MLGGSEEVEKGLSTEAIDGGDDGDQVSGSRLCVLMIGHDANVEKRRCVAPKATRRCGGKYVCR